MLNPIIFFIFILNFCNTYKIQNVDFKENNFKKIKNFINDGYDERYQKDYSDNLLMIVIKHLYKKKILDKLEDPQISIAKKLELIEKEFPKNEIQPFNIMNGGLLNDFNFELD
jgi:predicted RND superfamily exporter protein